MRLQMDVNRILYVDFNRVCEHFIMVLMNKLSWIMNYLVVVSISHGFTFHYSK